MIAGILISASWLLAGGLIGGVLGALLCALGMTACLHKFTDLNFPGRLVAMTVGVVVALFLDGR